MMSPDKAHGRTVRLPLTRRSKRIVVGAVVTFVLGLGSVYASSFVGETRPDRGTVMMLLGFVLVGLSIYVAFTGWRVSNFPNYEVRMDSTAITLPRYPLWRHETVTIALEDVTRIDLASNQSVSWLVVVTDVGRFRIGLDTLPPGWNFQTLAERIMTRVRLSRVGEKLSKAQRTAYEALLLTPPTERFGVVVADMGKGPRVLHSVANREAYLALLTRDVPPPEEHTLFLLEEPEIGRENPLRDSDEARFTLRVRVLPAILRDVPVTVTSSL